MQIHRISVVVSSFLFCFLVPTTNGAVPSDDVQLEALTAFKNSISGDPLGILAGWTKATHHCIWFGVDCDPPNSTVVAISLADYGLAGTLSPFLGNLSALELLELGGNHLIGPIPLEIWNLSSLTSLNLAGNHLFGNIPVEIARLSAVHNLSLAGNYLSKAIPVELFGLEFLEILNLSSNRLSGAIPDAISNAQRLSRLDLSTNVLEGSIPGSLGRMKRLTYLDLSHNHLDGSIPGTVLGNMTVVYLNLSSNFLSGAFPSDVGLPAMVRTMDISGNNLSGSIPSSLKGCGNLVTLDLSSNSLSGRIPAEIFSGLGSLASLALARNDLSGHIPWDVGELNQLASLDLSHNQLTGSIPSSLASSTTLRSMDLSFNQLEGPIPAFRGKFRNMILPRLEGNRDLCGEIFPFPPCDRKDRPRHLSKKAFIAAIAVSSASLFLLLVLVVLAFRWYRREARDRGHDSEAGIRLPPMLKRYTIDDLMLATDDFDDANVVGSGALSTVYRGRAGGDGQLVAFKMLSSSKWEDTNKCFMRELRTLSELKHRNLVKVVGYAWDARGLRVLALEYMENGSLEAAIHGPGTGRRNWPFLERLRVCVSVANALAYLHTEYGLPVVHGDVKPSNVLLDADWEAHLGDFGSARMLGAHPPDGSTGLSTSYALQGTIGYIAPEYAYMGRVTTKVDVFGFGILVMEFLTAIRPTGARGRTGDPCTLQQHVAEALAEGSEGVGRVTDAEMSVGSDAEKVAGLLEIALSCTRHDPKERPEMEEVLSSLLKLLQ